jgi:hypothetical protein
MLAVNRNKMNVINLGKTGYSPGLFGIDKFLTDTVARLVDILANIIEDREGVELPVIGAQELDYLHHFIG